MPFSRPLWSAALGCSIALATSAACSPTKAPASVPLSTEDSVGRNAIPPSTGPLVVHELGEEPRLILRAGGIHPSDVGYFSYPLHPHKQEKPQGIYFSIAKSRSPSKGDSFELKTQRLVVGGKAQNSSVSADLRLLENGLLVDSALDGGAVAVPRATAAHLSGLFFRVPDAPVGPGAHWATKQEGKAFAQHQIIDLDDTQVTIFSKYTHLADSVTSKEATNDDSEYRDAPTTSALTTVNLQEGTRWVLSIHDDGRGSNESWHDAQLIVPQGVPLLFDTAPIEQSIQQGTTGVESAIQALADVRLELAIPTLARCTERGMFPWADKRAGIVAGVCQTAMDQLTNTKGNSVMDYVKWTYAVRRSKIRSPQAFLEDELQKSSEFPSVASLLLSAHAKTCMARGEWEEADRSFARAYQVNSNDMDALRLLMLWLASTPIDKYRNPEKALALVPKLRKDERPGSNDIYVVSTAYAAAGDFETAMAMLDAGLTIVRADGPDNRIFSEMIELYEQGKPWYQPLPKHLRNKNQ